MGGERGGRLLSIGGGMDDKGWKQRKTIHSKQSMLSAVPNSQV